MYTHSEYADPDPMDADGYLIPPNAVLTEPGTEPDMAYRWTGDGWKSEPDMRAFERHAIEQRRHRNFLLLLSDWTQLPDAPLTTDDVTAWRLYRQRLRDVTVLPDWPFVTMPAPPDGSGRA
ncbi:MAG: phage tail assembly chaperone [Saprospiraceae bacterium]